MTTLPLIPSPFFPLKSACHTGQASSEMEVDDESQAGEYFDLDLINDGDSDSGNSDEMEYRVRAAQALTWKSQETGFCLDLKDPSHMNLKHVVVCQDGTNSPFTIPSEISLRDLHTTVAEKLNLFPDRVVLRYWLDSDKQKDGATSIQTSNELNLFKARLRALIVPQRLTNGKPSTRPIKKVTVYFEAIGVDGLGGGNAGSSGDRNAAHMNARTTAGGKGKGKGSNAVSSNTLSRTNEHEEMIRKLEECWTCKRHSEGPGSPTYCYSPAGGSVCYPLTHCKIILWAAEIIGGMATIDDKPSLIHFHNAKSRTHTTPNVAFPQQLDFSHHQMGPYGGYVFVYPPWNPPGYQGSHAQAGYPPGPSSGLESQQGSQQGQSVSPMSQGATLSGNNTHSSSPFQINVDISEIPDIISWFKFLDHHDQCNKDGITFVPFGDILKDKGFTRLSQLIPPVVQPSHLEEWLGVKTGIAFTIMQYILANLNAINSGRWIFPRDGSA
ncbi:hypothetical protein BDN67DRAFT_985326 [Paxillus ammoniavirescens]|nr:hypothetical protein BDN67DRAFT_985326 [Paxillus ammoniavirescens]